VVKHKNNTTIIVIVIIIAALFFFFSSDGGDINIQSVILPELDNRITHWDVITDDTQPILLSESGGIRNHETLKFSYTLRDNSFVDFKVESIDLGTGSGCRIGGGGGTYSFIVKKDFAGLNTFLRLRGSGVFRISGVIIPLKGLDLWTNVEVIPDNLNVGIYDIFIDGEFWKRINTIETVGKDSIIFTFNGASGSCPSPISFFIDFIKYVPVESFTIKNDEVWVKEVRGSTYSFDDLDWEMIGFQSEIRPATIRDSIAETEIPTPQIYINLINDIPVKVQPETVHTFFYRTKWVEGLDSSCQGDLSQVNAKQSDGTWKCEGFVKETPIIQQCQVKTDCPILPDCEPQRDLVVCTSDNLCDYELFNPQCKNQLITFQEKVTEIEKEKFVPIPSGSNSFFCFFNKNSNSCSIGVKTISVGIPNYGCSSFSGIISTTTTSDSCWNTDLSFSSDSFIFSNNEVKSNIGFDIKSQISMSARLDSETNQVRDDWSIVGKFTLPDDFLEIKSKSLGNKFILKDSTDKITFTITNNLFGIDGGYTIQTQNLGLQGGVVLRNDRVDLFLNEGDNEVTYNFETSQIGTIVDLIGKFGKVSTDREYIFRTNQNGFEKFLVITKEVVLDLPTDLGEVRGLITQEKTLITSPKDASPQDIPTSIILIGVIIAGFFILRLLNVI